MKPSLKPGTLLAPYSVIDGADAILYAMYKMYAPPANWQTARKFENWENSAVKPMVAPTIATLSPSNIPNKNGVPFFMPNAAPVAAHARGAGPGEPSKSAVVVIRTINDSSNLQFPKLVSQFKPHPTLTATAPIKCSVWGVR